VGEALQSRDDFLTRHAYGFIDVPPQFGEQLLFLFMSSSSVSLCREAFVFFHHYRLSELMPAD
jgi:hypothetical protein